MRACIAPLGALALAAANVLASLGHDVVIFDSYGRCSPILEDVRVPEKIRLVDAPPSSKPLSRLLRRCEALLLALDPWDAGACNDWGRVVVGYALDALSSSVERIVVTVPAGAYAWSSERVECGVLPKVPPPVYEYSIPLSAAILLSSRLDSLLVVTIPPLIHVEGCVVSGRPERLNWFERLLRTSVLEARPEAKLSILDYRDAAETLALYLEGEVIGWVCVGGVTLDARRVAEKLGYKALSLMQPDTIVVEGGGARRRTLRLLESLGLWNVHG